MAIFVIVTKIERELLAIHDRIAPDIAARLEGLSANRMSARAFQEELAFCLCTPQTSAHKAAVAVESLFALNDFDDERKVAAVLRESGVRFHLTKAVRIKAMLGTPSVSPASGNGRAASRPAWKILRSRIEAASTRMTPVELRSLVHESVNGFGLKESSHFLRNLGLGDGLCILDRHILRCLVDCRVIPAVPVSLSASRYLEIERKMAAFARRIGIGLVELDFVFWYRQNGEVYK